MRAKGARNNQTSTFPIAPFATRRLYLVYTPERKEVALSSRRPPRGGPQRSSPGGSGSDDSPAQTTLGLLLQRALEAQQQPQVPAEPVSEEEKHPFKPCYDCWHAVTFRGEHGPMARCDEDLWLRPAQTVAELNENKIKRWYVDCPAYDDSE